MRGIIGASMLSLLFAVACVAPALESARPAASTAAIVPAGATCAELGHGSFGTHIEPVATGSYPLDAAQGGSNTVTLTVDPLGLFFDWTTTRALDAVVVGGGSTALFERYTPAAVTALARVAAADLRARMLRYAETLAEYNEGPLGLGTCDDGAPCLRG